MSEQTVTATLDRSTAALLLMGGVIEWTRNIAATPTGFEGFGHYSEALDMFAASGDDYAARLCDARGALGFESWEDARLCALSYALDGPSDG